MGASPESPSSPGEGGWAGTGEEGRGGEGSQVRYTEPAMKVVGKRKIGKTTPEDADRLLRTAWAVRQTDKLVPKGLYRFRTFQEAEEWMTRMMASTYVRLRSKTSSASAEPSTKAPPSTS